MRISKITINNLFDKFNYEIKLNIEERVTIIIGPNGYGKTTILRLLDSLLKGNLSILYSIPYKELKIDFAGGQSLSLTKEKTKDELIRKEFDMFLTYTDIFHRSKTFNLIDFLPARLRDSFYMSLDDLREDLPISTYRLKLKELDELSNVFEVFKNVSENFQDNQVSDSLNYRIMRYVKDTDINKNFKDLYEVLKEINVHFTTTQRLIAYVPGDRFDKTQVQKPVVNVYSEDLSKQMKDTLSKAMQHANEIDSSFPKRITDNLKNAEEKVNFNQLIDDLHDLEIIRSELRDTGLFLEYGDDLDVNEAITSSARKNIIGSVLKEYIKDTRKKFNDFTELKSKLKLLKEIINDRFAFKALEFSKENGFVIIDKYPQGYIIPVEQLSSGEQQELVMFYEFLFKVPSGSLLLIDEPELSLHIEWQQKFLKDLLQVAQLVGFDVLIATHAPAIIHDYWNLTFDLGEESNVRLRK